MAQQGEWTLQQIAKALGKHRATIARWLRAYRQGGLPAKMAREHGGRLASLNSDDVDVLKAGLKQGGFQTAKEIHQWLKERGSPLTLWGVYYWREDCQGQTQGAAQNPQRPGDVQMNWRSSNNTSLTHGNALDIPHGQKVYVWVCDEHRYGLISHVRRCLT